MKPKKNEIAFAKDALVKALNKIDVNIPKYLEAATEKFIDAVVVVNAKATMNNKDLDEAIAEWGKTDEAKHFITAPICTGGGALGSNGRHITRTDKKAPANWELWAYIPHCEVWQAVALSLDIEPPDYSHEVRGWPPEYERRLKITKAHIESKSLARSKAAFDSVDLPAFREWAQSLEWNLPEQFPHQKLSNAPAKLEPVPVVTVSGDDVEEQAAANDHDETLAALFDPVPVEALEKMFPTHCDPSMGKWKGWAEKAASNGLKDAAKTGRGLFNPYKAGVWFLSKGINGWDIAHLNRTLAKNLPARSRDDAHLLTGGID